MVEVVFHVSLVCVTALDLGDVNERVVGEVDTDGPGIRSQQE